MYNTTRQRHYWLQLQSRNRIRTTGTLARRITLTIASGCVSMAATAVLPSASVGTVSVTSPVVRATAQIAVSATVTATFDSNSGPVVTSSCSSCNKGDSYCGTGNSAVKSQSIVTSTSTTVNNMSLIVNASPEFGWADPTVARLDGPVLQSNGSGVFSGYLPVPTVAADGIHTVTVTGLVSERVTTASTVTTNSMSGSACGGSVLSSVAVAQPPASAMKFGAGSGTGTYVLNINPPTLSLQPATAQPHVMQGNHYVVHNVLAGGAERTPYTVADTAIGPAGYSAFAAGAGAFGPATPAGTGIAAKEHDTVGVHIACNAPLGDYLATSAANAVDLLSFPFGPVTSTNTSPFVVDAGLFLEDQTVVVSELPPDGDYAPMTCFSAKQAGRNVNTSPGTLHLTAVVNTAGPCAGFSEIRNTVVSLTLPPEFSLLDTGASPSAHVFVGPAVSGFDWHNPQTLTEVTARIPKAAIAVSGQTVTVDLSQLDLGGGPGVIPSSDTIYVRVHAAYSSGALPIEGTAYMFSTSTTATLPGIGTATNASFTGVTAAAACITGN
jgi:hypothetical protein